MRLFTAAILLSAFGTVGCPSTRATTTCAADADCDGQLRCVAGECVARSQEPGITACTSDADCRAIDDRLVCNSVGLCDLPAGGDACVATAECPPDQFCNAQSRVCVPLQQGFCRSDVHCGEGLRCAAPAGGVGRCVECLQHGDCDSGQCLANGTCAVVGSCDPPCGAGERCVQDRCVPVSDCDPPCLAQEQCVQGVCYGENGCPRHAHPSGNQCVCDAGYTPSATGDACVPAGDGGAVCDPLSAQACTAQGGIWDGVSCTCDTGNACQPPCTAGEVCRNGTCRPASGDCATDLDCKITETDMFVCDPDTSSCTCSALWGIFLCLLVDLDFDPAACDCDWAAIEVPDAGAADAARPDRIRPDSSRPDAGPAQDSSPPDAAVRDSALADTGAVDASRPPGAPGEACTDDDTCTFTADAYCYPYLPEGYCSAHCDYDYPDEACGPFGTCVCFEVGWFGCDRAYCYARCDAQLTCDREGYGCVEAEDYGLWARETFCYSL